MVDDHLMRVTHVVRGEGSGWPPGPSMFSRGARLEVPEIRRYRASDEGGGERQAQAVQAQGPRAGAELYRENGYPSESVAEYLMTLLNSNFEEWRLANRRRISTRFRLPCPRWGSWRALFDLDKAARREQERRRRDDDNAQRVYDAVCDWAREYDRPFTSCWPPTPPMRSVSCPSAAAAKSRAGTSRLVGRQAAYEPVLRWAVPRARNRCRRALLPPTKKALALFCETYDENDTQEQWFDKLRRSRRRWATRPRSSLYKQSPERYPGHGAT